ncbi:MAG: type IV secretion system protein [Bdellovibrionales bacterium]|nr:type IV secretion system protein [Bdellovibrionales bacterium]
MFEFLPEVCREIRGHLVGVYWMLIVPFVAFLIILEFFKVGESIPKPASIIHRAMVSILLLLVFEDLMNVISVVGDGVTNQINGLGKLTELLDELQKQYEAESPRWLQFREALIFIINLVSYLIAYIGIFITNIMLQFVWSILYVVSPLMILMYISPHTSYVTHNLFKGLINVVIWKILWSILGVMLLKFAVSPEVSSWDNFFTTALVNICIGLSMLFVPLAAKSLVGNGLTGAATALAMLPTAALSKQIKSTAINQGQKRFEQLRQLASRNQQIRREPLRGRTNHNKENI